MALTLKMYEEWALRASASLRALDELFDRWY